ncbi:hypothetical protein D3C87_599530 [compost metagenome]
MRLGLAALSLALARGQIPGDEAFDPTVGLLGTIRGMTGVSRPESARFSPGWLPNADGVLN